MAQDDWILDPDVVRSMDIADRRRKRRGGLDRIQRLRALGQERLVRQEQDVKDLFPDLEDDEDPDDILVIVQAILDTVGWTQSKKIREIKTLLGVGRRRPRGFSK